MNERWMPKNLEIYWSVIDTTPMQFAWQGNPLEIARWEAGNVFKTHDQALIASINIKSLLLSLHDNDENLQVNLQDKQDKLQDKPLPKLTAEVFDRPDCPAWAKYAAVDRCGVACVFDEKPKCDNIEMWLRGEDGEHFMAIRNNQFDATDWQHSLIERPVKPELPEWVEIGGYVYDARNGYGKIVSGSVKSCYIEFDGGAGDFVPEAFADLKQARLRPYNADEIPKLPFEVSEINSDFRTIVVSCKGDKIWLGGASTAISTEELMRDFTINNKPAGVLEHRENGEWVQ